MEAGEAKMEVTEVSTNRQIYNRERRNGTENNVVAIFVDAQTEDKTRLVSNGDSCNRDDTRQEYGKREGQLWKKDGMYFHQIVGDKGVLDNGMISCREPKAVIYLATNALKC